MDNNNLNRVNNRDEIENNDDAMDNRSQSSNESRSEDLNLSESGLESENEQPQNGAYLDEDAVYEHIAAPLPTESRERIREPVAEIVQEANIAIEESAEAIEELEEKLREAEANLRMLRREVRANALEHRRPAEDRLRDSAIQPYVGPNRPRGIRLQRPNVNAALIRERPHLRLIYEQALAAGVDLANSEAPLSAAQLRRIIIFLNGQIRHLNDQQIMAIENLDNSYQVNDRLLDEREARNVQIAILRRHLVKARLSLNSLKEKNTRLRAENRDLNRRLRAMEGRETFMLQKQSFVTVGYQVSKSNTTYSVQARWRVSGSSKSIRPSFIAELNYGLNSFASDGFIVKFMTKVMTPHGTGGDISIGCRYNRQLPERVLFTNHVGISMSILNSPYVRAHMMADVAIPLDEIRFGKSIDKITETHLTGSLELGPVHGSTICLNRAIRTGAPEVQTKNTTYKAPATVRTQVGTFGVVSMVQPAPMPQSRPSVGVVGLSCLCIVSAVWIVLKRRFRA